MFMMFFRDWLFLGVLCFYRDRITTVNTSLLKDQELESFE